MILHEKSAKVMRRNQQKTFVKKSLGTQILVQKQSIRLKIKTSASLHEHLLEFEGLIHQLLVAGAKLTDAVMTEHFKIYATILSRY